jgi:hypothetical protein
MIKGKECEEEKMGNGALRPGAAAVAGELLRGENRKKEPLLFGMAGAARVVLQGA